VHKEHRVHRVHRVHRALREHREPKVHREHKVSTLSEKLGGVSGLSPPPRQAHLATWNVRAARLASIKHWETTPRAPTKVFPVAPSPRHYRYGHC
jgi:hypothetical protein